RRSLRIRARDLGVGLDGPRDGLGQSVLRRAWLWAGRRGGRVELEGVARGLAGRRARAALPDLPEIVQALTRAAGEVLVRGHAFAQLDGGRRDVVDHPVDPRARGRVGILADECQRLRIGRDVLPAKRWRHVAALAAVLLGNRLARLEGRAG